MHGPRRLSRLRAAATALLLVAVAACSRPPAAAPARTLRLATWNLEWLVGSSTAHAARLACARGVRATLPCDVAVRQARDSADVAALRGVVRRLDADVLAFQEVEDGDTARRVFRGYALCFGGSRGVQDTGFAVRRDLPFRCGPPIGTDSGRGRNGATVELFPGTPAAVHLLAVHLKSGCPTAPLDAGGPACTMLARQAHDVARWIDDRDRSAQAWAVLGDFNRDLAADARAGSGLWPTLAGTPARLGDTQVTRPFVNCQAGQPFTAYIDHILAGARLAAGEVADSFAHAGFDERVARRSRLSDHCPVTLRFRWPP